MSLQIEKPLEYDMMPHGIRSYFFGSGSNTDLNLIDVTVLTPRFSDHLHFQVGAIQVVDP